MGVFSKIFGRNRADQKDAMRIYRAVMEQSRRPEFFGDGRFPDNYDGRIDLLTLNLSVIMKRLRDFGDNGKLLSQAIYDNMRDDFEISLREEGLSDTGVAKRIKPMIRLFYDRLKTYDSAIGTDEFSDVISEKLGLEPVASFVSPLSAYVDHFFKHLQSLELGEIAQAKFTFPMFGK